MTAEIKVAFAHPEARAAATAASTAPADPLDRISLRDYQVEVEIGAFQAERGTTQTICFNIVVEVAPLSGPIGDDVDRILSYDRITWAIDHELGAERLNLLETLAERVAERILQEPQARRVFVRIEKLDRGPGALGVEIVRARTAPVAAAVEEDTPDPRVVYLANAVVEAGQVGPLLDRLQMQDAPVVLCVGAPEGTTPVARAAMAQRRIDLLAIEQNAWVLAGQDPRCVVVRSRTELEWAMKNGQPSVWAPSKIVLDAVERPDVGPEDPLGLALWFAAEMGAQEFLTLGVAAPDAEMPTREVLAKDL